MLIQKTQFKVISGLTALWMLLCLNGCFISGANCGSPFQVLWSTTCRDLNLNFSKTKTSGTASCTGVTNSRKLKISCPTTAGNWGRCSATGSGGVSGATGAAFNFVLVPYDGSGTLTTSLVDNTGADPGFGCTISSCGQLWSAMTGNDATCGVGYYPTNITAVYFSTPTNNDDVVCDDTNGCYVYPAFNSTTTNCFAGWDPVNSAPLTTAASLSGNYLACGYIDSTNWGSSLGTPPPYVGAGIVAISTDTVTPGNNVFVTVNVAGNITFSTWADY